MSSAVKDKAFLLLKAESLLLKECDYEPPTRKHTLWINQDILNQFNTTLRGDDKNIKHSFYFNISKVPISSKHAPMFFVQLPFFFDEICDNVHFFPFRDNGSLYLHLSSLTKLTIPPIWFTQSRSFNLIILPIQHLNSMMYQL